MEKMFYYSNQEGKWKRCTNKATATAIMGLHIVKDPRASYSMGEKKPYVLMWADQFFGRFRYLKSAQAVGQLLLKG